MLTIGALADSSEVIRNDWFEHKLVRNEGNSFALNVERISYNDEELSSSFNVMLMSSVNNLMSIGGTDKSLYDKWIE